MTPYSEEIALSICERLANGEPLAKICRDESMPHLQTIYKWLADENHKPFKAMYEQAREDQADTLADRIQDAANDLEAMSRGEMPATSAQVQAKKVMLDALMWSAEKLRPKKYGQRIQQDITTTSFTDVLSRVANEDGKQRRRDKRASSLRSGVSEHSHTPPKQVQ